MLSNIVFSLSIEFQGVENNKVKIVPLVIELSRKPIENETETFQEQLRLMRRKMSQTEFSSLQGPFIVRTLNGLNFTIIVKYKIDRGSFLVKVFSVKLYLNQNK